MSRHPTELKEKAFALRTKGYSVKEIAKKLGIAQGTSSVWVRDIKLNAKAQERLNKRRLLPYYKSALRWQKKRIEEERCYSNRALYTIDKIKLDVNHAKLYCSLLYWCEGGKGYTESLKFVNSDPSLIKTFLKLLRDAFQLDESKFRVLMHLHFYHNEKKQKYFWSRLTQIPKSQFNKTFLKHNTRKRIKDNYPGCIAISYHDRKFARELRAIYRAFSEKMGA